MFSLEVVLEIFVHIMIIKQANFWAFWVIFFSCIFNCECFQASLPVSAVPGTPKTSKKKQCAGPSNLTHAKTKPRCRVKRVHWCLPGLHSVAQFLRSVPPEGFLSTIVGKILGTQAVKIEGTILHVNLIRLWERNELNLILLSTSLQVVSEVRIYNFQVNYFLTAQRLHVRITQAHWRAFGFVLPYIILVP